MSKETLANLIMLVPDKEVDTLYKVILKFIPEGEALPGELEAVKEARKDRETYGTVAHEDINWK